MPKILPTRSTGRRPPAENAVFRKATMRMTSRSSRLPWFAIPSMAALVGSLAWLNSGLEGWRMVDFKKAYYAAGDTVLHHGSAALWPLIDDANFVNLPIVAWVFAPLAALGPRGAGLIFMLVGLGATIAALMLLSNLGEPKTRRLMAVLFVLNGPLWYSLILGNTTHVVLLLLIGALLLWKRKQCYAAGLVIGISIILKPAIVPLAGYFVVKRHWRVVGGAATAAVTALVASVLVFGLQFNLDWYRRIIVGFAGRPMGAFNVQSLDAFLLRLETGQTLLFDWHPQTLPLGLGIAKDILVAVLAASVVLAIWRNRKTAAPIDAATPRDVDFLEFCLVLTLCVMISTVSWTHYYLLLLLPFGLYLAGALPVIHDRLTHRLMRSGLILCSLPVFYPSVDDGWFATLYSRTLQSIWLYGGLLMLCALLRCALLRNNETKLSLFSDSSAVGRAG